MLGPRIVNKSSAPNYSMPGRSNVGSFYQDLCKTPGPCNYQVVSSDVYKRRAPRYSLSPRRPPLSSAETPGPGQYSPRSAQSEGPTFGIRHSEFVAPLIVDVPQ
ncbi:outer dense fiber protein 3 [Coturnix japonica]|uniref:outer dense fiber protein 3 n=1 Tax=Coturnix japonica TaxID=93934 RepID=UPI0007771169|nr:outer dense fiber protein 3 [Coturnix japonica]